MLSISQRLCEVRDKEFDGVGGRMALGWQMYQATLARWIAPDPSRRQIPDATWYDFLSQKLGEEINVIHRRCQIERERRENGGAVRA